MIENLHLGFSFLAFKRLASYRLVVLSCITCIRCCLISKSANNIISLLLITAAAARFPGCWWFTSHGRVDGSARIWQILISECVTMEAFDGTDDFVLVSGVKQLSVSV